MKRLTVYVAITVYDFEGESFDGVFATPTAAKESFPGKHLKWSYDKSTQCWSRSPRGGCKTYEVRRETVR